MTRLEMVEEEVEAEVEEIACSCLPTSNCDETAVLT